MKTKGYWISEGEKDTKSFFLAVRLIHESLIWCLGNLRGIELGHILSCVDDIESEDVENEEAEKGEEKATDNQRIEWPMVYLRRNMDDGWYDWMWKCVNSGYLPDDGPSGSAGWSWMTWVMGTDNGQWHWLWYESWYWYGIWYWSLISDHGIWYWSWYWIWHWSTTSGPVVAFWSLSMIL